MIIAINRMSRNIGYSMFRLSLCLAMLVIAHEGYADSVRSEQIYIPIDISVYMPNTLKISPNKKRIAYIAEVNSKKMVVVDGISGQLFDDVFASTLKFSEDSKRFAYIAVIGDEQLVVTDGLEERHYQRIITHPIFSPGGRNVAYIAQSGKKQFVVVNGKEGPYCDEIIDTGNGKIIFTSDDAYYYFAKKDDGVYLIEERIEKDINAH
jgi:hypothetical protein